jgi:hypothetical protein
VHTKFIDIEAPLTLNNKIVISSALEKVDYIVIKSEELEIMKDMCRRKNNKIM